MMRRDNGGGIRIIGVTGGSGAGKGSVCRVLTELGGRVIDADALAHEIILLGQPAYGEILGRFGDVLGDGGEIDRRKLGAVVFADEDRRMELNRIVHRRVFERTAAIIDALKVNPDGCRFIALDVPLLFESGMDALCHSVWGIFAPKAKRIARIMSRDGITLESAERRMASQMDDEALRGLVDHAIDNDGSVDKLRPILEELLIYVLLNQA